MRSIAAVSLPIMAAALGACATEPEGAKGIPQFVYVDTDGEPIYGRNLEAADRSIKERRQRGELTKADARALRKQNEALRSLAGRYEADGISQSEARELDMLSQALLELSRSPVTPPAK